MGMVILLVCSLLWVPGIITIISGRLSPIVIFLILISLYLFVKGEDTTAGFILALTSGSFIISGLFILLILIYGLLKRRWSIISAYLSGLVFMIIVSYLLLPSWPRSWLRLLLDNYSDMQLIQTPIMRIAALLPGIENPLSIFLHAVLGLFFIFLLFTLRGKSDRLFIWNAFATLVISYLINIQGSIDSLFILYPAIFLIFRFLNERWGLFGRIFSWTTIVIFSILPWIMILPVDSFKDPVGLSLLSIVLPLLVLIGINWIRWWALNIPRLPFESL
jgi:hypothetical protein